MGLMYKWAVVNMYVEILVPVHRKLEAFYDVGVLGHVPQNQGVEALLCENHEDARGP